MNLPRLHTVDVKSGKFIEIVWRDPQIVFAVIANEPEMRRIQISAMVCKANKALDSAADLTVSDPAWLWQLKIKGKCALDETEVERAFLEAAKSNPDGDVFKKATVVLRASPLKDADIKSKINNVEWLLLNGGLHRMATNFSSRFVTTMTQHWRSWLNFCWAIIRDTTENPFVKCGNG